MLRPCSPHSRRKTRSFWARIEAHAPCALGGGEAGTAQVILRLRLVPHHPTWQRLLRLRNLSDAELSVLGHSPERAYGTWIMHLMPDAMQVELVLILHVLHVLHCATGARGHCQPPLPAKPLLSSIFFCPLPFCDFCCAASCFRSSSGTLEMDDFISICLRSYLGNKISNVRQQRRSRSLVGHSYITSASSLPRNVIATPLLPARPVRPIRCV